MLTRGRRDSDTGAVWPDGGTLLCSHSPVAHIQSRYFSRPHCATEPMCHIEAGFSSALWDPLNHPLLFSMLIMPTLKTVNGPMNVAVWKPLADGMFLFSCAKCTMGPVGTDRGRWMLPEAGGGACCCLAALTQLAGAKTLKRLRGNCTAERQAAH